MGTVAVNFPKSPITKDSGALSPATLPDLCKFPAPPAPFMVIPLPNIGMSNMSPAGFTKEVISEGSTVSIQGSSFKSTGDEASPLKGLISGVTGGITEYITPGSMNVKFEGKNVQVLGDLTTNNAPPAGGGGGGGAASGISAAPKAVAQPAAKKQEQQKKEEPKGEFEISCAHGRKVGPDPLLIERGKKPPAHEKGPPKPNAAQLLAPYVLEVVCLSADDIKLKSTYAGDTEWLLETSKTHDKKSGAEITYTAKPYWYSNWGAFRALSGLFKPKETLITARAVKFPLTKQFKIREYPGDSVTLSIKMNRKDGQFGAKKELVGAKKELVDKAIEVTVDWKPESVKFKDGIIKGVKNLIEVVNNAQSVLRAVAAPAADFKFEFLPLLEMSGDLVWKEFTDHRVYLDVKTRAKIEIFSGELTIPFGPFATIPRWIKEWVTDWVGDAYFYFGLKGSLGLLVEWNKHGPLLSDWKTFGGAEGEIVLKIGAEIFLLKKSALHADFNGNAKIVGSCGLQKERLEQFEFIFDIILRDGLKVEVTIKAAWGIIAYKREWVLIEERSLIGGPKKHQLFASKEEH